ncbi:unnamed protein product [Ilex paraguariensis]|uniref:Uncharacterized protein n=1 Tax=Ilex paraguariensis TaxID=185542 RepID=A0ABC8T7I5_9AQUA
MVRVVVNVGIFGSPELDSREKGRRQIVRAITEIPRQDEIEKDSERDFRGRYGGIRGDWGVCRFSLVFPCLDELWADGCWQWQSLGVQAYGVRPKDKEGMIGMEFLRALKLIFFPTGSLCDVVLSVWRTLLVSLVPAGFSGNICFFNAVVGVLMLLFCCLLSGCTVHVNCFAIAADCLFQLISVGLLTGTQCWYFTVLFSSISSLSKSTAHVSSPVAALLNLLVFQLVFQLVSCLYEPLSWPLYCFFGFAMKECWGLGIPAAFSYGVTAAFSDEFQLPLLSPFAAAFHASVHLITAGISAAVQLD